MSGGKVSGGKVSGGKMSGGKVSHYLYKIRGKVVFNFNNIKFR